MKKHQVGCVPDGRIGIRDAAGNIRGHVGPHATEATVMRFGVRNPQLKNVNGRLEWRGLSVLRRPRQIETANHKAARGSVKAR